MATGASKSNTKLKTIKVIRNIWGNHRCFIGREAVTMFGEEFDAQMWLNEQFATGKFKLSPASDLKPSVEQTGSNI